MKYPRSPFPLGRVFNAACANLDRWVSDQVAPPEAAAIATLDMKTALDENANALGGWRTPYVDVPTGTWFGNAAPSIADSLICYLAGYHVPFDQAKLMSLYPTRDDYLRRVTESADAAVEQRFLLAADAREIVAEAMRARVP